MAEAGLRAGPDQCVEKDEGEQGMKTTLLAQRFIRRSLIGIGAALIVAGFGYVSCSNELRKIVAVPESVREATYMEGKEGFGLQHAGLRWQAAVAREGHTLGFGLMTAGAFLLAAALPRIETAS